MTSIGESAFIECTGLTSVTFGNGVTSIGDGAFYNCEALTSVTIYAPSLTTYGEDAFTNNAIGRKIYVPMASLGTYQTNWSAYAGDIVGLNSCGDNVYYLYDSTSETLNIFGTGEMWGYNDFMDVPWNSYCDEITTIIIGNGVTHIGDYAFFDCTGLTSVTFGNSVTSIGDWAFYNCKALTSIEIPASVTSIGKNAFAFCTGLTSVTFGNGVTSIGDWAFYNCEALTSIEIPASVTSIGNSAFAGCTGLASISVASGNTKYHSEGNCLIETASNTLIQGCKTSVIPTGVTSIGNGAFMGCTSLTSIEIPNSVTSIGNWAFKYCSSLTSVTFGNSVTSIGGEAFSWCTGLTSIEIPASVTSIGGEAFSWCTGLTSIEIPASVTSIGVWAFYYCSNLSSVTIYAPSLTTYGEDAFTNNAIGRKIYVPMASLDTYKAAAYWSAYAGDIVGFSSCGDNVYYSYDSTSKTLNIFGTGDMADYTEGAAPWNSYKGDITTVVIGNGVTHIGNYAFNGCNGLFVLISEAATPPSLGSNALDGCTLLNAIGVPSGTASAYKSATNWAAYADKIFAIDGTCGTGVYYAYNSTSKTLNIFGSGAMKAYPADPDKLPWNSLTTVVIGNGVTSIGENAFRACTGLASIEIPASVTSIGITAFAECTGLASIEIPASVTSIGVNAFALCTGLTSVTFGNGVTSIGDWAFYNCEALTSIEIPASVTSIGNSAFAGCTGLASISVASGNTKYHSDGNCIIETATKTLIQGCKTSVIPTGVESIGERAFSGCTGLTSITIPNSVTSIGSYAFIGCTSLTSVTFGNSVTSIGSYAFYGCTSLTSIEIPASVTIIDNGAFLDCSNLSSVIIYAPSLTTYGYAAFYNNASGRKIYVFSDCVETYKGAANWSSYAGDILPITLTANEGATGEYWTTYYNELANAKVPDGAQAFKVTLTGTTLKLTEIEDGIISKGEAVVIKSTSDSVLPEYSASGSNDTGGNDLKGTMTRLTNPNYGKVYVLNKKTAGIGFYKLSETGTIAAHKAYLVADGTTAPEFFGLDGDATEISRPTPDPSLNNGGKWHDLSGRKLDAKPTKKGVYINNGRKVVVK